jgi:hypothetical protein
MDMTAHQTTHTGSQVFFARPEIGPESYINSHDGSMEQQLIS